MNGDKRIEERPAAPAPTKERKAPEIEPDPATMLWLGSRDRPRPWVIVLGMVVFFAALWLTVFALNADFPAWTVAPVMITGIAVMLIGGATAVAGLVGW